VVPVAITGAGATGGLLWTTLTKGGISRRLFVTGLSCLALACLAFFLSLSVIGSLGLIARFLMVGVSFVGIALCVFWFLLWVLEPLRWIVGEQSDMVWRTSALPIGRRCRYSHGPAGGAPYTGYRVCRCLGRTYSGVFLGERTYIHAVAWRGAWPGTCLTAVLSYTRPGVKPRTLNSACPGTLGMLRSLVGSWEPTMGFLKGIRSLGWGGPTVSPAYSVSRRAMRSILGARVRFRVPESFLIGEELP
jgi:hypothetical protein